MNAPSLRDTGFDMVKVVWFFLIGILVLAMFGRLRFPGQKRLEARKCPKCGRYQLGSKPCDCSTRSKPGK